MRWNFGNISRRIALDLDSARAHPDRLGKTKEEAVPRFSYGLMAALDHRNRSPCLPPQPAPAPPPRQKILPEQSGRPSALHVYDGKTMVFKMRNGTTYINHLRGACPGLRFNGFSWELRRHQRYL